MSILGWMLKEGFSEDVVSEQSTLPPHPTKDRILPEGVPAMQMVMPVGGFLVLGFVIAGSQWLMKYLDHKKAKEEV